MSRVADDIKAALEEAVAHAKGEPNAVRVTHVARPVIREVDVVAVRAKTGLSQSQFAASIGVSVNTLRGWEQGQRKPQGATLVLYNLLDRDPQIVQRMLAA